MLNAIIGKRIRECRLQREMTQERLADYLNISHQLVSKWENGITTPNIEIIFSISQLFNISIDYLCGAEKSDIEKITEDIMRECPYENIRDYDILYDKYTFLDSKIKSYPLNEELLAYSLKYLRWMHDQIYTDEQKDIVNELILANAQRILDISKNDDFRSIANFNIAVYYAEHINMFTSSPEGKENARKAREYADRVLYKDMDKVLYNMLGAENDMESRIASEETLKELIQVTNRTIKNLLRHYNRQNLSEEIDRLSRFAGAFAKAAEMLDL